MSETNFRCRDYSCRCSRANPTSLPAQDRQVKFAEIGSTPLVRSTLRMQSFDEAKIVFNQQILCIDVSPLGQRTELFIGYRVSFHGFVPYRSLQGTSA